MPEKLGGRQITQSLMRPDVIVEVFPVSLGCTEGRQIIVAEIAFVEFFGMGALRAFDGAIQFRGAGRQDEEAEAAVNSGPPSTCRARRGNGMRAWRVSKKWVAVWAVARV
jgi:hypothetical protein